MTITDEITPLSVTDVPIPEETAPTTDDLTCEICGTALTYAGRGRKPKFCDDHKPSGSRSKTTKTTSSRASKDERMRQELTATLGTIGVAVMAVNTYDGLVVIDKSADVSDALMELAAHNPRVRKALEQMLEVSVWAAVATAVAGIAVPIAVNHNLLPLPQDAVERQFLSPETRETLDRMRAPKPNDNG